MEINLHPLEIFLSSGRGCPPPSQGERQRDHAPSAGCWLAEEVKIGDRAEISYEDMTNEITLPKFRKV
jgi:hypothetical protein